MFASQLAAGKGVVTQVVSRNMIRLKPLRSPFVYLQKRTAYRTGYPGGGPRYSRFHRVNNLKAQWTQSPAIRYGTICLVGCGVYFYTSNLEEVPVSGRRRFNVVSPEMEKEFAKQMYQQVLRQFGDKVLPTYHPDSRLVQRVLNRLIPASGLNDLKWEVHVIDDPKQINAFVIPGGILPICETEDGLAVVLGHEIAHNVAHHAAERLSQVVWVYIGMWGLAYLFGAPDFLSQILIDFGFTRPGSRGQESEADYIGLMMMAQSCYDPEAAVGVWKRMEKAEQFAPPQWLSTHPSSQNRVTKIQEWLPEAENKRAESDCGGILDYAQDFRQAYHQVVW
ncbi:hypothetical protein FGG08_000984 [Glutinoglossum americanum]|uniref:Peptidase M48 domain-containing protein n=1 Tax=Glutinoglossum americanum TaxID=1670608 RepID=A0A9P8L5Q6_9PEZI|nr:hypothetical protein FGG08_000984 [Glutinoglossum americanum]